MSDNTEKRFMVEFYEFDSKTRELVAIERLTTKPMTKHRFNQILKKEIKKHPNACWSTRGKHR